MADDNKVEIKDLVEGFKKANDEVKKIAETSLTEAKNLGKITEETKAAADKALTDFNTKSQELDARLAEVEQKVARRGVAAEPVEAKTIGQTFMDDEKVKSFLGTSDRRGSVSVPVDMKTVVNLTSGTTTQGATASVTTSLVSPTRAGLVQLPDRRMVVRDLLMPGNTNSNNIEYAVQTAFQNFAATVAEGGTKPQSDMAFDLRNAPVRTIAHYVKASRQIMDDAPQLQSFIDGRLRYGLMYVEEAQLLNGDGTGQNILGLVPQATAYSGAFTVTGETTIDRIRLAALQATLALYPASGIVLHPTNWAKIEMQKDGMGRYLAADPQGVMTPRLWGLPVVATQAMAVDTFLAGSFRMAAQIFDRMSIEVLLSTENDQDFIKNLVTIRAEERLALAVYAPLAFVTGSLAGL